MESRLHGSRTLPPPGWVVAAFYYNYDIDTVRNRDSDRISFDPERRSSLTLQAFGPIIMWVSGKEILGWNQERAAFWETHSDKEDSAVNVGDLLTVEGGLGRAFAEGAINVGVDWGE